MRKHLVVAVVGVLSVTAISAPAARATHENVAQPGETMQISSERVFADDHYPLVIAPANGLTSANLLRPGTPLLDPSVAGATDTWRPLSLQTTAPQLDTPPAPGNPDGAGAASSGPPLPPMPLPVLTGPASPDGAPAPGTLPDALAAGPVIQTGLATWYGPGFTGGVTYCGEIYDQWAMTAASNTLPCGTVIVVTNQSTGLSARVRITDRGGFGGSVILDLSRAAFLTIAPGSSGVIAVSVALALP